MALCSRITGRNSYLCSGYTTVLDLRLFSWKWDIYHGKWDIYHARALIWIDQQDPQKAQEKLSYEEAQQYVKRLEQAWKELILPTAFLATVSGVFSHPPARSIASRLI